MYLSPSHGESATGRIAGGASEMDIEQQQAEEVFASSGATKKSSTDTSSTILWVKLVRPGSKPRA